MSLKTPIAFIIFNRPDLTAIVFERIREAKPDILFIIADGPRVSNEEDISKSAATRKIVDEGVDWPCEVFKNYSDVNLGCGKRVSSGIDWVFQNVEKAIILEDDCLTDISFFNFAEELLIKYEDDKRVMHINGTSWNPPSLPKSDSYFFSAYSISWGWATWKRAWEHFDFEMKKWNEKKDLSEIYSIFNSEVEINRRRRTWKQVSQPQNDIWGYQWFFAIRSQNGICITPRRNLIKNVGLRSDATHTLSATHPLGDLTVFKTDNPLSHPTKMSRNKNADIIFESMLSGINLNWLSRFKHQLRRLLKKL